MDKTWILANKIPSTYKKLKGKGGEQYEGSIALLRIYVRKRG
jgi:hypothetical protein